MCTVFHNFTRSRTPPQPHRVEIGNSLYLNRTHSERLTWWLFTNLQPNAQYQFSFDISDDESTNYHNRKEQRDGEKISGSYSVVDSDGFIRTVTYTADPQEVRYCYSSVSTFFYTKYVSERVRRTNRLGYNSFGRRRILAATIVSWFPTILFLEPVCPETFTSYVTDISRNVYTMCTKLFETVNETFSAGTFSIRSRECRTYDIVGVRTY